MDFSRIDIHTHLLRQEEDVLRIYDLPFPERVLPPFPEKELDPSLLFTAGLHPLLPRQKQEEEEELFTRLEELAAGKKLFAIGECGMDKNAPLSREEQYERFRRQALLAEKYSLPLILHCVRFWDEVFALRKECRSTPWLAHSFRGSPQLAEDLEEKGIHISFAPVFLEKSEKLKEYLFLRHIFLETDDKDLPLPRLYRLLAEKWEIPEETLQTKINNSFHEVFYDK